MHILFRNYLTIAWRNIIRHKWASMINVFGLAVGMTASIMLYIYISYETSFDRFHEHGDKVYRIISHFRGAQSMVLPRTFPDVGQLLTDQSPLVSDFCRAKDENTTIRAGEQEFENVVTLMVDASFERFFSFPAKKGNVRESLSDPSSIVLSSEMAERLFGDDDPVERVISISKTTYDQELQRWSARMYPVRVGAVLAPMPSNTHLRFDALLSFDAYDPDWLQTFANDVFVFLMVEGKDPDLNSIAEISAGHLSGMFGDGIKLSHQLQPISGIHFGENYGYDIGPKGSLQLIVVFIILAVFIISIAVINFINLVTARAEKRAIEASIRKVAGASRGDIRTQFLVESVVMSLLAFALAMVLVELFLPSFSQLLNRKLHMTWFDNPRLFFSLMAFAVMVGLVSGIIPAILFSHYQPAEIMRGKFRGGSRNPLFRIVLVVVQFTISVILIISITVFNRQVHYMKTSDLGFESENLMFFHRLSHPLISGYDALKAELLQDPRVLYVSAGQGGPSLGGSGQLMRPDMPEAEDIPIAEYRVREDYKETFGLELIEGRWFNFSMQTDLINFVLNESAVKAMGLAAPIGQDLVMINTPGKIIGVVKDFHMWPLRNEIQPLVFTAHQHAFYYIFIKLSGDEREHTISHIRDVFTRFDPNYPFNELYLDERFMSFYREEEQNNTIMNVASVLAIIIAMLGLFGLSAYIVMARKKEIGIRKIVGATGLQIAVVLFRDIGRWVILANVLAWPVAWYAMDQWLSGYPYRINLSWWFFALAGLVNMLIAGVTISGQTWKAARSNPAEALKTE